jgi:hypothetical protein
VKLYRNDLSGPDTNGSKVFLDSAGQPGVAPNGYGALVVAEIAGQRQIRAMNGGGSYLSQTNSPRTSAWARPGTSTG